MSQLAEFGQRLRQERERRGVSLEAVANHTKVSASLFAEMERGRFKRWPPGLFGRAFIRGYAEAVGIDPVAVVNEYNRFVPDDEAPPVEPPPPAAGRTAEKPASASAVQEKPAPVQTPEFSHMRLTLEAEGEPVVSWRASTGRHRLSALGLDGSAALLLAAALAFWMPFATGSVIVLGILTAYYAAGVTVLGTSPSLWWFTRGLGSRRAVAEPRPVRRVKRRRQDLSVSPNYYRPPAVRHYGRRSARPA